MDLSDWIHQVSRKGKPRTRPVSWPPVPSQTSRCCKHRAGRAGGTRALELAMYCPGIPATVTMSMRSTGFCEMSVFCKKDSSF